MFTMKRVTWDQRNEYLPVSVLCYSQSFMIELPRSCDGSIHGQREGGVRLEFCQSNIQGIIEIWGIKWKNTKSG